MARGGGQVDETRPPTATPFGLPIPKVDEGFRRVYDDDNQLLITLFSAGGSDNKDLPDDSSYRSVTPMTVRYKDGKSEITPCKIDYARYNTAGTNKFFESRPEIQHQPG
jgi:hypothetical protein